MMTANKLNRQEIGFVRICGVIGSQLALAADENLCSNLIFIEI